MAKFDFLLYILPLACLALGMWLGWYSHKYSPLRAYRDLAKNAAKKLKLLSKKLEGR